MFSWISRKWSWAAIDVISTTIEMKSKCNRSHSKVKSSQLEVRSKWHRSWIGVKSKWIEREFQVKSKWDGSGIEIELKWHRRESRVNAKWIWRNRSEELNRKWSRSEVDVRSKWYRSEFEEKTKCFESEFEVKSKSALCDISVKLYWNQHGSVVNPRSKVKMKSKLNRSEPEVNSKWSSKWGAGEVALSRSNPRGKSKRNGIDPPPPPPPNILSNFSWLYRYMMPFYITARVVLTNQ